MGAGIFALGSALIGAASASSINKANISAASNLNEKNRNWQTKEAQKQRDASAAESALDRQFQAEQAATAQAFGADQALIERNWQEQMNAVNNQFNAEQAGIARSFNASEAAKTRAFNMSEAEKARAFNAKEAATARAYNTKMANTAHQREMADLRKAGLNPILAANNGAAFSGNIVASGPAASGGTSASSPAASSSGNFNPSSARGIAASGGRGSMSGASSIAPVFYGKKDILGQYIHTALDGFRIENEYKKAKADLTNAQANMMNAKTNRYSAEVDAAYKEAQKPYIEQQIKTLQSDERFKNWQSKTEEEKVKLVKEQIITEIKRQTNEARLTDAKVSEAGAVAYHMVKTADTDEKLKEIQGRVSLAKNDREREALKMEATKLEVTLNDGKKRLEREMYNTLPGKGVYVFGEVMKAVTPFKFDFGGK